MRIAAVFSLLLCATLVAFGTVTYALSVSALAFERNDGRLQMVAQKRKAKDCTPYNGPFGFYGNIWCQPPNVPSYMRNLGSSWPQKTPPVLKTPKSATDSGW